MLLPAGVPQTKPDGRPEDLNAHDAPNFPRNYDDWNEAFWSRTSLRKLYLDKGGSLLDVAPGERWAVLHDVRWADFFNGRGRHVATVGRPAPPGGVSFALGAAATLQGARGAPEARSGSRASRGVSGGRRICSAQKLWAPSPAS